MYIGRSRVNSTLSDRLNQMYIGRSFVIHEGMESVACGAKFYRSRQKRDIRCEYRVSDLRLCTLEVHERYRDAVTLPEIVPTKREQQNQHRRRRLPSHGCKQGRTGADFIQVGPTLSLGSRQSGDWWLLLYTSFY